MQNKNQNQNQNKFRKFPWQKFRSSVQKQYCSQVEQILQWPISEYPNIKTFGNVKMMSLRNSVKSCYVELELNKTIQFSVNTI